jgi:glycosyltransferase involved in cell wall biosynthesis
MTQSTGGGSRIGIVPARFGPTIVGGAEIVLRHLAAGLQERGWDVEIITTCATDYFSWENDQPPGCRVEDGLVVRRFPAVRSTPGHERYMLSMHMLAGEPITLSEQNRWMNDDIRVPELFEYLVDNHERYDVLLFAPYLFWLAYTCSAIAPEKSVLLACLHDEPYAHQRLFEPMFCGLAGILFMTEPECQLAERIHPSLAPRAVVGCGVEIPGPTSPERFRRKYGIDRPFVLYAGRREGAKGWDDLLAGFARAVVERDLPLALVSMGAGEVRPPSAVADRVFDLGFLPDADRDDAYAAATAYVQPSSFEAFSRTIMEAWLAETPVIGYGGSEVVTWHIARSEAGLIYSSDAEFDEALALLVHQPEVAARLGRAGRAYVLEHYQWPGVLDQIEKRLIEWTT